MPLLHAVQATHRSRVHFVGIALAVKTLRPDVEIIGVESESCPSFSAALEAGEPVTVEVSSTLADGLAVPKVGPLAFQVSRSTAG